MMLSRTLFNRRRFFYLLQVSIVPLLFLAWVLLTITNRSLAAVASIDVTTVEDELLDNGRCSLREAIRAANLDRQIDACRAGSGSDTIILPDDTFELALVGTGEDQAERGDLDILDDLTIRGEDDGITTIDGDGIDRVLEIHGDIDVVIRDVTIRGGLAGPGNGTRGFEGRSAGGGIANQGDLRLENVDVTGNRADSGDSDGTDAFGGGILNNGELELRESSVTANSAVADNEGGGRSGGGGIYNGPDGTLRLEQSTIVDNTTIETGAGILNHGEAELRRFTVIGNLASGGFGGGRGGGLFNSGNMRLDEGSILENATGGRTEGSGGGIANTGTLSIRDVAVRNNIARAGIGPGTGGGIWNSGRLFLERSTVSTNRAQGSDESGTGGSGGGIWNEGTLTVDESTIHQNVSGINRNPFSGGEGGGITNNGTLKVAASTVSENVAVGISELILAPAGGGIMNHEEAEATIDNSTISGNVAGPGDCGGSGGGIMNMGELSLTSSTVTENRVEGSCDDDDHINGGGIGDTGRAELHNSIVAGNLHIDGETPDCHGTIESRGRNLIGDSSGCRLTGNLTGNLDDVDPRLGRLRDNGGRTFTHALLSGSPAIDAGTRTDCPRTDQRGERRPQDGDNDGRAVCDTGAFELEESTRSPTPTSTRMSTATATITRTPTPSATVTATRTPTPSATVTATRTPTPTVTATAPAATSTPSPTATVTPDDLDSPAATSTAAPRATSTRPPDTPTVTSTPSVTTGPTSTPGPDDERLYLPRVTR